MAEKKLVHPVTGEEVGLNDPMPATEPGHKGESLGGGKVFDPNAALREKNGVGPGLQDSERLQPAHWPQETSDPAVVKALAEREAQRLEKQAQKLRDDAKDSGASVLVGEADLRGETKSSK